MDTSSAQRNASRGKNGRGPVAIIEPVSGGFTDQPDKVTLALHCHVTHVG